eukprot:TRINITY_DN91960_c0_g1_i1.p1 TRINITY_DN91960_c0_g1~~TRINITY_DN91960_c0_g1_i1.p1  ORF type:complete len:130 (+),score=4.81 TRINITY_DN91960_c0_g1_i1:145-534(+)
MGCHARCMPIAPPYIFSARESLRPSAGVVFQTRDHDLHNQSFESVSSVRFCSREGKESLLDLLEWDMQETIRVSIHRTAKSIVIRHVLLSKPVKHIEAPTFTRDPRESSLVPSAILLPPIIVSGSIPDN